MCVNRPKRQERGTTGRKGKVPTEKLRQVVQKFGAINRVRPRRRNFQFEAPTLQRLAITATDATAGGVNLCV